MSTVRAQPNHYEALGIGLGASVEEIARAFSRKMTGAGLRPMAAAAQIYAAYETLRNPDKRRVYDQSLEANRKAAPAPGSPTATQWSGKPFMMAATAKNAGWSAPEFPPSRRPEVRAEPGPFVAEPVLPNAGPSRARELLRRLEEQRSRQSPSAHKDPMPQVDEAKAAPSRTVHQIPLRDVEDHLASTALPGGRWNRTALVAGSLLVGVALVGAWSGTTLGHFSQASKAASAVTLALPAPRRVAVATLPPAPAPSVAREPTLARAAGPLAARRAEPAPLSLTSDASGDQQASEAEIASDVTAAPPETVPQLTPASMPLPNAVVARTIGRIGYSCGEVVSTEAVQGQAGVFNVTCTSGRTYRASPVHGRYRFRRVAG